MTVYNFRVWNESIIGTRLVKFSFLIFVNDIIPSNYVIRPSDLTAMTVQSTMRCLQVQ